MRQIVVVSVLILAIGMFFASILYAATGNVAGAVLYVAGGLLAATTAGIIVIDR
jgi:hypothetical protein